MTGASSSFSESSFDTTVIENNHGMMDEDSFHISGIDVADLQSCSTPRLSQDSRLPPRCAKRSGDVLHAVLSKHVKYDESVKNQFINKRPDAAVSLFATTALDRDMNDTVPEEEQTNTTLIEKLFDSIKPGNSGTLCSSAKESLSTVFTVDETFDKTVSRTNDNNESAILLEKDKASVIGKDQGLSVKISELSPSISSTQALYLTIDETVGSNLISTQGKDENSTLEESDISSIVDDDRTLLESTFDEEDDSDDNNSDELESGVLLESPLPVTNDDGIFQQEAVLCSNDPPPPAVSDEFAVHEPDNLVNVASSASCIDQTWKSLVNRVACVKQYIVRSGNKKLYPYPFWLEYARNKNQNRFLDKVVDLIYGDVYNRDPQYNQNLSLKYYHDIMRFHDADCGNPSESTIGFYTSPTNVSFKRFSHLTKAKQ